MFELNDGLQFIVCDLGMVNYVFFYYQEYFFQGVVNNVLLIDGVGQV